MISLQNLTLKNWLSHKETTLSFQQNQKLLIDGNSGSGKSAVLEAIIWAFYGQGRTNNTSLVLNGADKAEVILTVDQDGREVVLHRTISAKGKHTLTIIIDGIAHPKTGVKDLQEWIEGDLTGASYLLFVNSVAYLQGGADNFVTHPATKRKELLLEIIKTIDFGDYYERVREKMREFELTEAVLDTEIATSQQSILSSKAVLEGRPDVQNQLLSLETEEAVYNAQKAEKEAVIASKAIIKQTLLQNEEARDRAETKVKETTTAMNVLEAKIEKYLEETTPSVLNEEQLEGLITKAKETVGDLDKAIAEATASNSRKMAVIVTRPVAKDFDGEQARLESEKKILQEANTCPQGDQCPNTQATVKRISLIEEMIKVNTANQIKYASELAEWQKEMEAFEENPTEDATTLLAEKDRINSDLRHCETKLSQVQQSARSKQLAFEAQEQLAIKTGELFTLNNEVTTLITLVEATKLELGDSTSMESDLLNINSALSNVKLTISSLQGKMGVFKSLEESLPVYEEKVKNGEENKAVISTSLQQLGLLKEAFGSKGIKSIVIDYLLPELEEKINGILSKMSDFRVLLDTQQERASGEGSKEGLFITIVNDQGEEMPLESYSGGEKLKIVVAITEALATLQKCGFRLFDEVFTSLDEGSLESFVSVLDTLLVKYPQVLCISHLAGIKAEFDDSVKITKGGGVSTTSHE